MKQEQMSKGGVWISIGGIMAWGKEPGACEDPPDGGDESREAGGHGAWSMEHGAKSMGHGARRISQQKIGEDRGEWYFRNGV